MSIHDLIAQRREALKLSQAELAERAETNQQTVDRVESGSNSKHMRKILDALGMDHNGRVVAVEIKEDGSSHRRELRVPEPEFFGRRDLPVYAAVEGGPGEMVISPEPIDIVSRPWFLEHVAEAYAVVVTGESMEPVYEAGDVVLVNPKLPPIKGKDAIFTSERFGGDFKASIKRFVRATPEHWVARQFTPPKGQKEEVRFARSEWAHALRVVGKYVP